MVSLPEAQVYRIAAIIVHSDLLIRKRGLMIKFHAFLIRGAIQDVGVMRSGMKPVLSPKLELLKGIKICDILNPSFQGIAGDSCYIFYIITVS